MLELGLYGLSVSVLVSAGLAVILGISVVLGKGQLRLPAELDGPYSLTFLPTNAAADNAENPYIEVVDGWIQDRGHFGVGQDREAIDEPVVRSMIPVRGNDRDTKVVSLVTGSLAVALLWVGLSGLRRFATTVVEGHPFDDANPGRLRRAALAVAGLWLLGVASTAVVNKTLDTVLPVTAVTAVNPGLGFWSTLAIVASLMAVSSIVGKGAELANRHSPQLTDPISD